MQWRRKKSQHDEDWGCIFLGVVLTMSQYIYMYMCVLLCIKHYFIMLGLIIYLMYHMSYILRPVPEGNATEEAAILARGLWSLSS